MSQCEDKFVELGKAVFEVFQNGAEKYGADCPVIAFFKDCDVCPFHDVCDLVIAIEESENHQSLTLVVVNETNSC